MEGCRVGMGRESIAQKPKSECAPNLEAEGIFQQEK